MKSYMIVEPSPVVPGNQNGSVVPITAWSLAHGINDVCYPVRSIASGVGTAMIRIGLARNYPADSLGPEPLEAQLGLLMSSKTLVWCFK